MTKCKACGQEIAKSAKRCPHCGAKNKKPIFKKWWFWAILVVLILVIAVSGNGGDSESAATTNAATANATNKSETTSAQTKETATETKAAEPEAPAKTEYCVGDVLQDGDTKIVFMSSGDYVEENEFMQPDEGRKYIYLQFAFENTSTSKDASVSFYNFECYADGYAAEMYYGGSDNLSATLSAGHATTGCVYYEVPVDAESIEVEYTTNLFTEEKIKFVFEGDKDSGYVPDMNAAPTEGAYAVGDVVESSKLRITYLSCGEYESDNMFVTPADGYHFISCEFEFENVGTSDEHISSLSFDCYADGLACTGTYIRDNDLSATLSAGRKTSGTVTFEVPIDAEVIEVEYLSNYWTSNRVVFAVN